ncbi:facilitated trehalose transporter Tret1-2 homolog isoform X2 [Anopheles stephensi]|uniref:facilitated trehalose transporter Tret1-2 homolog isoform X2 n=1 Tax=Anopheles stephensi TaxID=30069 RepID=UPI001658BDDA|nr:facilitated trehalose transporter Tret1-2 homolog isoform X2 [Anopheles stephensi]
MAARVGVLRQYMATVLVNLLGVSYGMISGWSSSALPTLQAPTGSPLEYGVITQHQASWIGGALCLGGIAGTLVGGAIVDRIGRKWTAWVAGVPLVVCWVLVIVADHPGYLMGARFLGGLAGGIEFVVTPLYVSEIACTRHRGTLSSLLILSCCLGVELAYLAGALLHYHTIPWISVGVPVFFLASFCFLPETPSHLAKAQKLEAAEQSLRFFYGIRSEKDTVGEDEYVRELQLLQRIVHAGSPPASQGKDPTATVVLSWSDFTSRHARHGLLICVTLMALNQFCGCFYMMNYAQSVFAASGSVLSLPASLSVIVVGLIQLVGCYVCTLLVDRIGRKILLLISSAGLTLGQSVFSSYCYGQTMGLDLTAFGWVPLVCFSVIVFIGTVGVGTMPFVVLAEIMPQKIKGFATTFCMVTNWTFAFIALKYFSTLSVLLGMHGILMFFAICSLIGTLFVLLCMPETKGKSFQEIQYMMEK